MMDKLKHYMKELEDGWIHNSMRADWRWCPRYFKLRYIDGMSGGESDIMLMGTDFHNFSHKFYQNIRIHKLEEFNRLIDLIAHFKEVVPENDLPIMKIYKERFATFEARRYWYFCRMLGNADEEFIPRYTELDLRYKAAGERYGRAGTIDAIFCSKRRLVVVIRVREYKASRKSDATFVSKVRGQLAFYKSLITETKLLGDAVDIEFRFELYNPILDNGVFPLEYGSFERTRNGIYTPYWFYETPLTATERALDTSMKTFIEAMESEYYPKKKSKDIVYTCRYCNFYGHCWGSY